MDVVEYFKAEQRICKFYMQECRKCPLSSFNNGADMGCTLFVRREPEKCANIMKKWAVEHGEVITENQRSLYNDEKSCENCDFERKGEDEHPCVECKERYTLKFKPKTELKPCPFCGGEAERRESPGFHNWWVICKQCHAASMEHTTAEGAVKAWNRRAD